MHLPMPALKIRQIGPRRLCSGRVPGLPEISNLGFDTFTKVGKLGKHHHRGQFEFCLIIRGHVTWWVRDRIYELRGGDVYFTWPNEPHGGFRELMHPCTIYWLTLKIPQPDRKESNRFLHLPTAEARHLCKAIYALPDRHLEGAQKLQPYFESMFEYLSKRTRLGVTQTRAAIQQMLATLVTLPLPSASGFRPPGIERARSFLDDCPRPWPKVAELAGLAGMSTSHFHASFLKQTGMAPMDYAHRKRLEKATVLLSESGSVTAVALKLGYCSSQHLAACFKRQLGITPTQAKGGDRKKSGSKKRA